MDSINSNPEDDYGAEKYKSRGKENAREKKGTIEEKTLHERHPFDFHTLDRGKGLDLFREQVQGIILLLRDDKTGFQDNNTKTDGGALNVLAFPTLAGTEFLLGLFEVLHILDVDLENDERLTH
jgi:hypothetical protein